MAWGQGRSQQLMGELLGILLEGKPANWQNTDSSHRGISPTSQSGELLAMGGTVDPVASTTLEVVQSASSAKQYPLQ
eukprot:1364588-Amphidinium_carterae.1